ncbi:MAG: 1-(5-phosphoribosyl)-5-[Clostridia bacterium]|nr:1-(5-phosphoribosyl)-5-[(5-phosphoribosylamino)methylideneamino]imidazole-4-carboxamide isomerase [Clostridia bacterium]
MIIFPAIDLYEGKAVRLLKGDYRQMTVYSEHPEEIGRQFAAEGATHAHLVDLEGARDGTTPNLETVRKLKRETGLFCEIGGGIRSMETVRKYLDSGLDRVILGTAAVRDPDFLARALAAWGERIAVGVDIRDGYVSVQGWTEDSGLPFLDFCRKMAEMGVRTLICTDISRDGAMRGTNRALYEQLGRELDLRITASGGVSSLEDVQALRRLNLYGAIIGKAWYTGAISLREAIEEGK